MSVVERMSITMTAELGEVIRQSVASGEYASSSEVIRAALREWARNRDEERRDLEALRAAIKSDRDGVPGSSAEQVLVELRARYASKD